MQSQEKKSNQAVREDEHLDRRYGEIGISAVAAAIRYRCPSKNPAYAPAVHRPTERDQEAAA